MVKENVPFTMGGVCGSLMSKRAATGPSLTEGEPEAKRPRVDAARNEGDSLRANFESTNTAALRSAAGIKALSSKEDRWDKLSHVPVPYVSLVGRNYDDGIIDKQAKKNLTIRLRTVSLKPPDMKSLMLTHSFPANLASIPTTDTIYVDCEPSWSLCQTDKERASLAAYTEEAALQLGHFLAEYDEHVYLLNKIRAHYGMTSAQTEWTSRAVPELRAIHYAPSMTIESQRQVTALLLHLCPPVKPPEAEAKKLEE